MPLASPFTNGPHPASLPSKSFEYTVPAANGVVVSAETRALSMRTFASPATAPIETVTSPDAGARNDV
ncbi:hypothetical protein D3C81_2195400 [compost metagenome]